MFQRCVETTLELSEHLHREKKKRFNSQSITVGENGWSATGGSNMKVGVLNLHHSRTVTLDSIYIYIYIHIVLNPFDPCMEYVYKTYIWLTFER